MAPTAFGTDGKFGGGERYPLELARALAGEVDCELIAFGPRPRTYRDRSGLRIRVVRPLGYARGHPAHPVAPQLSLALDGADVVHTHHLRSAPSRVAAVAGRLRRQRLAVTDHGLGGGGWFGLLPHLFDAFLCVSRYSARTLSAPPHKTDVIYGGADADRFQPGPPGARAGVLFVGRLTPHKGVDRLLRALPPGASLTVVGTGGHDPRPPERDYPALLHRLADGLPVRFLAAVTDDELGELYRSAAVAVLPSVHRTCYGRHIEISELLGLSAIEAMASGTPVVASRLGGLPEIVVDGETGFLVEPGDVEALRDRLAMLLTDPALARRLGDNGRDLVCQRLTWTATARRCLRAYELLTGPA